jgi:hypothetical protein
MSDYNLRFPRIGLAALVGFLAAAGPAAAEPATSFAFDFGSGAAQAGYVKVLPGAVYSKEVGYGFDLGTAPASFASGVTSEKPFFFSVAVPEGNYNIVVTFGDAAGACVSTVKAESRRLMLEEVATAAGKFETRTFVVNVRNFRIPPPPRNAPGGGWTRGRSPTWCAAIRYHVGPISNGSNTANQSHRRPIDRHASGNPSVRPREKCVFP